MLAIWITTSRVATHGIKYFTTQWIVALNPDILWTSAVQW